MIVLGAGLAREKDKLLGADPVRVDVDHELQPGAVQLIKAEISHFDIGGLFRGNHNPGTGEIFPRLLLGRYELFFINHRCLLLTFLKARKGFSFRYRMLSAAKPAAAR